MLKTNGRKVSVVRPEKQIFQLDIIERTEDE